MKRLFKFAMFVALAATTFTACQKDNTEPNELGGGKLVKMTFHAGNPEIGTAVRTEMEGLTPYWSVGDVIGVSTDGTTKQAQFTNDATERAQSTTFTGEIETSDVYYAYYPYTSNGLGEAGGNKGAKIDLPSNQSPTATSFDGKADILVSQPISGEITSLKFRRLVGIAKIVLKDNTADNLLNGQHVSSLTMTVSDKNLAGRYIVDLLNYTMYEPYYNGSKSIQATYTAATTYPIDGTGASYLCVYPQELAAESTLTIEASTEGYSIKKEITLPSAIKLEAGKITTLNIGLTEEHLTAEAAGLALPFSDDFSWANSTLTTALKIDEYPEGKYTATAYTYKNSGCLKFGSSKYEGYFTTAALDLSREFTVIVNAKRYNESKASLLSITAGNATKTAELQAEAQDFVFQFEPQGNKSTVKVEILEIDDPRGYIYRIDIVEGQGTVATPLDTPTGLATEVDGNMVLVGWKPVAGATSYTVSFEPATIEPKTVLHDDAMAEYSELFEGLDYATEYTVSVVANPADTENYKASAPATATFTTGENPNHQVYTMVGDDANLGEGQYIFAALNGTEYLAATSLEESKTYGYLPFAAVMVNENQIASNTTNDAYAFTLEASDTPGQYYLKDTYGRYMYNSGSYNSFNVASSKDTDNTYLWTISMESDGTVNIKNVSSGKWMQYDSEYHNYAIYDTSKGHRPYAFKLNDGSLVPPTPKPILAVSSENVAFAAAGESKEVTYTAENLGSNQVFATVSGENASQFLANVDNGTVTVTALENTETTAKTATLTLYIAASEGGEHLAEAIVALTQAGVPTGEDRVLTFDFTSNISGWPLKADSEAGTSAGSYVYSLNGEEFTFTLTKDIYCNNGYLFVKKNASLGLPAIPGYKLVKVTGKLSNSASIKSKTSITSDASGSQIVEGGEAQTWDTKGGEYTYDLTNTVSNTVYYMHVDNTANSQYTKVELTYAID
ncbi:fimbrillin family protein [uncultured Alistipes sp.]|uniref:fimbrillin family protein n=1 Tax=uncultured Alistipes sp. TaxID=538949 RepID=UPI00266651D7|nr:fimbrillin family protein [uncultured Alistipes sp.]